MGEYSNLSLEFQQRRDVVSEEQVEEAYASIKAQHPNLTDKQVVVRLFTAYIHALDKIKRYQDAAVEQSWKDYARQQERSGGTM